MVRKQTLTDDISRAIHLSLKLRNWESEHLRNEEAMQTVKAKGGRRLRETAKRTMDNRCCALVAALEL